LLNLGMLLESMLKWRDFRALTDDCNK
jgi:hypothetical protein